MPNDIATTNAQAVSAKRLPNSVERALADSLSLEHPDVPWTLPAALPTLSDLRVGIAVLEAQAAAVSQKHAAWCLAKLVMAFEPNTRLTAEETRLRLAVWIEANGDLGDSLWSEATLAAIQGSKWMPKPGEFRQFVAVKLAERAKRMQRCRAMMAGHGRRSEEAEKPIETRLGRLEHTRSIYARMQRRLDVERIDREIAVETGQPVPAPSIELAKSYEPIDRPPVVPLSSDMQARTLRSVAKSWRAKGNTERAEALEREADSLAPESSDAWRAGERVYHRGMSAASQEPPEHRDIPESDHGAAA